MDRGVGSAKAMDVFEELTRQHQDPDDYERNCLYAALTAMAEGFVRMQQRLDQIATDRKERRRLEQDRDARRGGR
jgi:hypothetical protein